MTGYNCLLLVFVFVSVWTTAESTQYEYINIIYPRYVRPGTEYRVLLDMSRATENLADGTTMFYLTLGGTKVKLETKQFLNQEKPRDEAVFEVPKNWTADLRKLEIVAKRGGYTIASLSYYLYVRLWEDTSSISILTQTDKGIYKAGQTVQFRIMGVNSDRQVVVRPMTIDIYDNDRNRVRRWENVSDSGGVYIGKMEMSEYPVLGTWSISVLMEGRKHSTSFQVKEFELPKFYVELDFPSVVSTSTKYVEGSVTAKYTFGKGVNGAVKFSMKYSSYPALEQVYKLEDGVAQVNIPLSQLVSVTSSSTRTSILNYRRYTITTVVTEDVTGIERTATGIIQFYTNNVMIKYISSTSYFRPNTDIHLKLSIPYRDGTPYDGLVSDKYSMRCTATVQYIGDSIYYTVFSNRNEEINSNNQVTVDVNASLFQNKSASRVKTECGLILKATSAQITSYRHYMYAFKIFNGSLLTLSRSPNTDTMAVGDVINFTISTTETENVDVTYQIISNGFLHQAFKAVSISSNTPYSFNVEITQNMIPSFVVVAWYILPNNGVGEPVADAIQVFVKSSNIEEDVNISFEKSTVRPGENVALKMQADPMSSLYVLAVDKSLLLLSKGNDITEKTEKGGSCPLFGLTSIKDTSPITFCSVNDGKFIETQEGRSHLTKMGVLPKVGETDFMGKLRPTSSSAGIISNAQLVLYNLRINIARRESSQSSTSSTTESTSSTSRPGPPSTSSSIAYVPSTSSSTIGLASSSSAFATSASTSAPAPVKDIPKAKQETIRKEFPDTWLFTNITTGLDGAAVIERMIPDTITTWVANCFSVSKDSFISVAKTKTEVSVFLPFFISVQLPFSVLRNEQVVLQANVFNYHTEDLYVLLTLTDNWKYKSLKTVKRGKKYRVEEICGKVVRCVFAKAGRATPVFFPTMPTVLGKIPITIIAESALFKDTVKKTLRVEPEGLSKSFAMPVLIHLTFEETFDRKLEFSFPPNTVEDSQRIRLSVIGDIMGPTIDGLERLVRMPTGCGEQNMVLLSPSIFVMKYLTAKNKLKASLKAKIESYISIGIQRQLRYKHSDWSFSAWGGSGSGSTWLTAFVLKIFALGKQYVFTDDQVITRPMEWLIQSQNSDGSFPSRGNVIHQEMQGGMSNSKERMTAYVLIALLESRLTTETLKSWSDANKKRLDGSIEKAVEFLSDGVSNHTSKYTVALITYALTMANAESASQSLATLESMATVKDGVKFWKEENTAPVSKYHYGPSTKAISIEMTAYALLTYVLNKQIKDGIMVQRWLAGQRNAYGGFVSTQDTVIGLQALAEMSTILGNEPPDMKIFVSYFDTKLRKTTFRVNEDNALVMQTRDISSDTTEMSVHAFGKKGSIALLTVSLFYNINIDLEDRSLSLKVNVLKESINGFTVQSCVSWLENGTSGMVVVEIGIPSGFEPNLWGISPHELLKRTEVDDRKVVLYYDEVFLKETCTTIPFNRDKMVANIKPVPCRAYEYYEPSNEVTVFYVPLTAKNSNICDICGRDCGCEGDKQKLWFPKSWCKRKTQDLA